MLQDTDLFDKLLELSNVGGDVHAELTWSESVSPDERYDVSILWRYRSDTVGLANYVIEPVLNTDGEYRLYWIALQFNDDWQDKGLYTTLVNQYRVLPQYGIKTIAATPWTKEAETRLASQGFEWVDHEFILDLTKAV